MSNNHLNDISRVYLSQVAEESPGEKIDRKSQEGVAKQKIKADAEKEARAKSAAAFQKHKNSVLAKGGRHVDALDSWHSKEAYERNASLREEVKCSKKGKKSTKSSVAQDPVENDQVSDQFAGMISSEGWKPDPVEKRKKKAADLYRREKIAQDTPAKYKTDKTEDPDKLYKRRMAVDSKTKMKEEVLDEVKVTRLDDKKKKEERAKNVKAMLARQAEWESEKKKALHASHEPEGEMVEAKVDAGKTPHQKEVDRNQRNTPPGANTKFDTSVFITRKSGESPTSARGRKRREAHAAKRGVK
jgi:hypothetical protein